MHGGHGGQPRCHRRQLALPPPPRTPRNPQVQHTHLQAAHSHRQHMLCLIHRVVLQNPHMCNTNVLCV